MKVNLLKQVCNFSLLYVGFCEVLCCSLRCQAGVLHRTSSFCTGSKSSVGLQLVTASLLLPMSGVLRLSYPEYWFPVTSVTFQAELFRERCDVLFEEKLGWLDFRVQDLKTRGSVFVFVCRSEE